MPSKFLLLVNFFIILAAYLYGADFKPLRAQLWDAPTTPSQNPSYTCENVHMRPRILSYEPTMIYIENFLTPYEVKYLKKLAEPLYERSMVQEFKEDRDGEVSDTDKKQRDSETAWLWSPDPVVDCIRARASEFQGFAPNSTLEGLGVNRYGPGGSFGLHVDWDKDRKKQYDRQTSFFVTLEDDCIGGSTYFPLVNIPEWRKKSWCKLLDCSYEEGVAVRPITGNAVFWVNFAEGGTGIDETIHTGQPVIEGTKIGMNIWTISPVAQ